MLDGLVRRAVFSVAHGVMREDEDGGQLHQGRQPDGGPRVIAEDEERRAEGPELRQRRVRSRLRAMACSRMPKCRFFPPGLSAWKSPAPS